MTNDDDGMLVDSNDRIEDVVFLETIYVAQHQTQLAYQVLRQAREEHFDNPALAVAVHALFISLQATEDALEYEWASIEARKTVTESRGEMDEGRPVLRCKTVRV